MKTNNTNTNNAQVASPAPVQAPTKSKVQLAFEENDQGRIAKIVEFVISRTGIESSIRFDLEQRSEQWLKWRRSGVTATEAVIILNGKHFGKSASDVWDEKFGVAKPQFINSFIKNGVAHEGDCIRCFEEKHHVSVQVENTCMANKTLPFLKASLDGYIPEHNVIVECKCPGEKNWRDVEKNSMNAKCIQYYNIQVQHQLLVSGAKLGFLCFWYKENPEDPNETPQFLEIVIRRDHKIMAEIIRKCGDFWFNNVVANKRPSDVVSTPMTNPSEILSENVTNTSNDKVTRIMQQMANLKEAEAKIKAELKETEAKLKQFLTDIGVNRLSVTGVGSYLLTEKTTPGQIDYAKFVHDKGIELTPEDIEAFKTPEKKTLSYRFTPSKVKAA